MRDILFLVMIAASLMVTVRYPFIGLLLWAWFTLATPQQAVYVANAIPLNVIIAGVTFITFFFHGEFRRARLEPVSLFLIGFALWLLVSHAMSLDQALSLEPTDRFFKVLIFIFLCMMVVTDRLRLHTLLWLMAMVMGFYGAKGGVYTIVTLGQGIYDGQPETILADNNHMGIGLAATLPLFLYLYSQTKIPAVRYGLMVVFLLSIIAIVGTTSRGAFLALIVFGGFLWLRSSRKLSIAIAVILMAIPGYYLVPKDWTAKMETIQDAETDESFQGRVDAWVINYKLARANPVTGAGLRTAYEPHISRQVDMFRTPRAAHSIYFEVLGGTGFVGLALYLGMIGSAALAALAGERRYRHADHDRWRASFSWHALTSLVTFCFGALSVSMEMWEGYLMVIAMISVLGKIRPAEAGLGGNNLTAAEKVRGRASAGAAAAATAQ